ncbi:MAG: hypothetical protein A2W61_06190 [Deltaproteobacteria bacterium RIFCSPLOWO2_01_44_7]|nr:MAG: hypothetical protein A2712_01475 [Deltaproteobacteria bacterium RIFCSPHIGHO2_01_FULL_43_49]OGQ15197.1 MAG: hypothetical protein A3D22_04000 [Deltaproteobacteria bacterium RIFCSPHIGHO2_02_FULL_44_53]OGQ27180.1 MAG: hypothetical protein A3D98_02065 [Deltaproteobacteria bacterium RIFCSPHIGHO2_12_FULL_44_21]OGQ31714.1 MAG: hypothetical protein A2979_05160 [Deltaproteobacteria bacterium RIFCSPLOWO2_01_FULL_45_74]OGQ38087.1 MAG: hypothetical protein A2W61_06190 [Deltaproteobacteria bacterium 
MKKWIIALATLSILGIYATPAAFACEEGKGNYRKKDQAKHVCQEKGLEKNSDAFKNCIKEQKANMKHSKQTCTDKGLKEGSHEFRGCMRDQWEAMMGTKKDKREVRKAKKEKLEQKKSR